MSSNCDSLGVNPRHCFQEGQGCHHIIQVVRCKQNELQMLASLFALGFLLATQDVLHVWRLAGRRTVTSPKGVEECITVVNEKGREHSGCLRDRHPCCLVGSSTSRPM